MDGPNYQECIRLMIQALAPAFGVDPRLACEIVRLESSFRPWAIGDDGLAVGLWQWHYQSWVYVRRQMAKAGFDITEIEADKRADIFESTITALYAIGQMGLGHWWSTYKIALRNVEGRDGQNGDQR